MPSLPRHAVELGKSEANGDRVGAVATSQMPISELVDLKELVGTHPWEVEVLGEGNFAYEPDWSGSEKAPVELIESLARNDGDFGGRTQEIWEFLQTPSETCPDTEEATASSQLDTQWQVCDRFCSIRIRDRMEQGNLRSTAG